MPYVYNTNILIGCIFNCRVRGSCQTHIICPESGEYCEINCRARYSCSFVTIHSQNTQNVTINFVGDYSGSEATIYTPGNYGNIYVNVMTVFRGFRYGSIIANTNTNEIHVLCSVAEDPYPSVYYYDCDYLLINASKAQYLNITAAYDSELTDSLIRCPVSSSRASTSCNIDCSYVFSFF